MHNLYMTDYGDVRISNSELRLLQLEDNIKRARLDADPHYQPVLLRAGSLRAACEQVALHKWLSDE
jgi:hypothetical protein